MAKEEKFCKVLQDVFIGAKIKGQSGIVSLNQINQITTARLNGYYKNNYIIN